MIDANGSSQLSLGSCGRSQGTPDYAVLIAGVQSGSLTAIKDLSAVFHSGIQFLLSRRGYASSDIGRLADQCINRLCSQIESGVLQEPSALPKFVRSIVNDSYPPPAAACPTRAVSRRDQERAEMALKRINAVGRKAVKAFYVNQESPSTICTRLGINGLVFQRHRTEARSLFHSAGFDQREVKTA